MQHYNSPPTCIACVSLTFATDATALISQRHRPLRHHHSRKPSQRSFEMATQAGSEQLGEDSRHTLGARMLCTIQSPNFEASFMIYI